MNRSTADAVHQIAYLDEAELRRVLRPGGRVALAEPDWDTLAIDAPDTATSRAHTRFITSDVVRNAAIGRLPSDQPTRTGTRRDSDC